MGTTESQQPIEKLNKMKKIAERGNYSIWEQGDKQYELILFTSSDRDFKDEEEIVEAVKAQNFEGLVFIDTMQISTTDKWHGKTNYLHLLTDHPKYTLQEYLNKNSLDNQQIVDLVLHIAGAQLMLGVKRQYIGFNNIYTSDGKAWKLKPFEVTSSFYSIYKENRKKIGTSFEMVGFPAPEEIKKQVVDHDRVSIFGFGMIILQLIAKLKSQDIYNKKEKGINEQLLQERINLLNQQKSKFVGNFIAIVIDMLDLDLTRRPNYKQLVDKLKAPASKISLINTKGFSKVSAIQRLANQDSVNFFNQKSLVHSEQIRIIEAVSIIDDKINHGLSTVKSKLLASTTKKYITNNDGTVYEGELGDGKYQGEGRITLKNGHVLFEGLFDKGNFQFGTLYFENPIQLNGSYEFNDCRDIFKYALRYEGKFQNNKKHGEGRVILTNGQIFWGDFKNDQIDGNGQYCRMDKSQVYGLWVDGIMHSTPGFPNQMSSFSSPSQKQSIHDVPNEISNLNQDPFTQLQNNVSNTNMPKLQSDIPLSKISEIKSSIEVSLNKLKLNLSQKQIQFEGETLYYDKFKKFKKYQGDHQQGVMHGQGTLYFHDGQTIQYEGDFQNDLFHGFGTLKNLNPVQTTDIDPNDLRDILIHGWWTSYDGTFMKGKKTGEGRLSLTNGGSYCGFFEQDQIHGIGYLTCPYKQDLYARWENGILKEVITGSI